MHYVPESACEFFQEPSRTTPSDEAALADVASLYALTALVGLLLATDVFLGLTNLPVTEWYRAPWGYRLALFAAVLGGARILYHSLDNLLAGKFGADLALTIACLAAIALGEHQTAGLVVFISLVGEAIEGFTLYQAKRAIRSSFEQRPAKATLIRDGLEREIAVDALQPGDHVVIRPGERVPADGRIWSGMTALNESPFSGESLPVDKTIDDRVLAGSINLGTAITMIVERTGSATALAEMEQLVRHATSRKMACERTADRLARWFLPAVLLLAALTLVIWRWKTGTWQAGWLPALGVLVVACPCPLVLATPCAVMAALAWLARRGIVVKGSAALERLATVDTFAFDKTGTLSAGDLALGDIVPFDQHRADDVLQFAASAERPSGHPIARLLRHVARDRKLDVSWPTEFASHPGTGITAHVNPATQVTVGSEKLIQQQDVAITAVAQETASRLAHAGQTPLWVAVNSQLIGVIGIRESLRDESAAALRELKQLGIRQFALLTGDRPLPAQAMARTLAVFDHLAAEQSPGDKARWIDTAKQSGHRVAMIGDGVNDGPALATADVGIAICRSGSELAGEAGDILFLGDPLRPLPGLVKLARKLVENIRQSIHWFAVGANGLGVLACIIGWLTPVSAAVFHEAASLLVMLNALRLLSFRDRPADVLATESRSWISGLADAASKFSPGHLFARIITRWRMTVQIVGCLVIAAWLCSQIVLVGDDERVVVLRGGKYHTTLTAGLSWRWPWPLERLVRLQPDAVQSVTVGFRPASEPASRGGDLEWTSSHDNAERSVPDESLYLTGDEVAVELTANVPYRIADVRKFAVSSGLKPEEILRATAESVLRSTIAANLLDDVLTERRAELEQQCGEELRRRLHDYDLGIEILGMEWLDVHPPRPVVDAYRQVSDAWEQREQAINEARALATRTLFGTAGEAVIGELAGAGDPHWTLTDEAWQSFTTPDAAGQRRLTGTAGAVLLDAEGAADKRRASAQGEADRLRLLLTAAESQRILSRHYFYWIAVSEALRGKPFTLIDPALSGRRHLFLGDMPSNTITLPMPGETQRSP